MTLSRGCAVSMALWLVGGSVHALMFRWLLNTDSGISSEFGREFRAANCASDRIVRCYHAVTALMGHFYENAIVPQ